VCRWAQGSGRELLALDLRDSAGAMSATTETFDVVNPAHIAATSAIGAAIALNDLPGKSAPAPDRAPIAVEPQCLAQTALLKGGRRPMAARRGHTLIRS
jgi:hypothetical protein